MPNDPSLEQRLEGIENKLATLDLHVHEIMGRSEVAVLLIKYVILPMLVILAGLVGLKLLLPGV